MLSLPSNRESIRARCVFPTHADIIERRSEFAHDPNDEAGLTKELILQVRKVIGPFAAPKKIIIVSDLPKTRSGKVRYSSIMRYVVIH